MNCVVIVNAVSELTERQSTSMLIASLIRRHSTVFLLDVEQWDQNASADLKGYRVAVPPNADSAAVARFSAALERRDAKVIEMSRIERVLIRTNPGRDPNRWPLHQRALSFCMNFSKQGSVINHPAQLEFFASKESLRELDIKYRPPMLVSDSPQEIQEFVQSALGPCVVKPVHGSRGRDVQKVFPSDSQLQKKLAPTYAGKRMIVQHFVESTEPGDKRVVVWGGKILEHQGHVAGVHRIPRDGEFRANIHLGAESQLLQLTKAQREAAEQAASLLMRHGIDLAGIDLVGSQVIEFNVFSTGGLYPALQFTGIDFSDRIVADLLSGRSVEKQV